MHLSAPHSPSALAAWQRLALAALTLAVLLPGTWGASLTDRDEGWYAQVSREMWQSGDWWVPRYLGEPWLGKPPLLYWCVATVFAVLGAHAGAARLVSVLALVGAVQLLAGLAAELYGRRAAWLAAVVFITAGLPAVVGRMVLTDALLLLTIMAAVWCAWRIRRRPGPGWAWAAAFWLAVGLGVLAKGPAVLVFVGAFGLALLVYSRREGAWGATRARPAVALAPLLVTAPLALLVAGPWYLYIARHASGALSEQLLGYEILARLTAPPHGHVGPPGYYLVVSLAGWLPWTVLVPGAVLEAWRARRADARAALLLWWCGAAWLVLELIPGKLPHYVLPCYVPLAILVGRMWDAGLAGAPSAGQWRVLRLWWLVGIVLGLLLFAPLTREGPGSVTLALAASGAALVLTFATVALLTAHRRLAPIPHVVVAGAVVVYAVGGAWLLPALEPYRLSRNLAEAANAMARPGEAVAACGYDEPSMFFYLAAPGRVVPANALPAFAGVAIVRAGELEAAGLVPDATWARLSGFNYVKGRDEAVWVGRTAPGSGPRRPP